MSTPHYMDRHLATLGIRSRTLSAVNGLDMHVLEAGQDTPDRPCILLLHGFPELAYSWRHVMPRLAQAGFYVVAPDQRGYGRTVGWDSSYDANIEAFEMTGLVTDMLALIAALGRRRVQTVVGHDFGASVAAWSALIRPDVFTSMVLMSAPFTGPPAIDANTTSLDNVDKNVTKDASVDDIHAQLAALQPARRHYQWYYSTRPANDDMRRCEAGIHTFLRAYYHMKSADFTANQPFELHSWSATELAKLPLYYVMRMDQDMAQTVLTHKPGDEQINNCAWLTEDELSVYTTEFSRTGFQGGLNWYRCKTQIARNQKLALFNRRTIDVPSRFIAGCNDWGIHQVPGALSTMQQFACTHMDQIDLIDNAGHWVQQEQPVATSDRLLDFLNRLTV